MHTFDSIWEIYAKNAETRNGRAAGTATAAAATATAAGETATAAGATAAVEMKGTTSFKARAGCLLLHYLWVSCMRAERDVINK